MQHPFIDVVDLFSIFFFLNYSIIITPIKTVDNRWTKEQNQTFIVCKKKSFFITKK